MIVWRRSQKAPERARPFQTTTPKQLKLINGPPYYLPDQISIPEVCSSSWSSRSYGPPVSVKVGSPALLTCSSPHPGDVRWTLSKQSKEFLVAECEGEVCVEGDAFENRTTVKQENTSLLLDPVAYTDAGWYISYCGGSVLCEVHLDVFAPVTISMAVGETVSLPCFVHTDQRTAGNDVLVRWEKDGKLVVKLQQENLSYGSGFEQRVSLSASRYKDGDLSLTISTFGSSDGGVYRCYYGNNELGYPEAVLLEGTMVW
ncbi:hypothetical protein NFI96_025962 [Prochilodus magdalenae]|nr:hypothetical protein NFI96_025962 [Prochilodus magdalenae]